MDNWKAIFTTDKLYQAEMVKEVLNDNQIEVVIMNHKDSSFTVGEIEVMVNLKDEAQAKEIIKSIKL